MVSKKIEVFKTNLIKTKNYTIKRNKLKLSSGKIVNGYTTITKHPDNECIISRNFLTQNSALKWARLMTKKRKELIAKLIPKRGICAYKLKQNILSKNKKLIKDKVIINYNDIKSIKKAEIKHLRLINKGLILYQTTQKGLQIFENTYI